MIAMGFYSDLFIEIVDFIQFLGIDYTPSVYAYMVTIFLTSSSAFARKHSSTLRVDYIHSASH